MATINGTSGDDSLGGTSSSDTMSGFAGNDGLEGFEGNDTISGGDGDDLLVGDEGDDTLNGDAGDDAMEGAAGNDHLNGGAGFDIAAYVTATSGVTVNLSLTGAQNTGGAGTDTLSGIEGIVGSDFNDTLTGDGGANLLAGGTGVDHISGGGGDDLIVYNNGLALPSGSHYSGGAGYDILSLGAFTDLSAATIDADFEELDAGTLLKLTAAQLVSFPLIKGTDTITVTTAGTMDFTGSTFAGSTHIALASGTNVVDLHGATAQIGFQIDGAAGVDTITGSALGDQLSGAAGDDVLNGGDGADTLDGGPGKDWVSGGAGDDLLLIDPPGSPNEGFAAGDHFSGGDGYDKIQYHDGTTYSDQIDMTQVVIDADIEEYAGGETVSFTAQQFDRFVMVAAEEIHITTAGSISLSGGGVTQSRDDRVGPTIYLDAAGTTFDGAGSVVSRLAIQGSSGTDTITGGGLDDYIGGNAGADVINGATGNDYLDGGDGDDTLNGGIGNDVLIDGGGSQYSNWIGNGSNVVNGGDGDDSISIGGIADTVDAGSGNDEIDITLTKNFVSGSYVAGDGDDLISISGDFFTLVPQLSITPGAGHDRLEVHIPSIDVLDLSPIQIGPGLEELVVQAKIAVTATQLKGLTVLVAEAVTINGPGIADLSHATWLPSSFSIASDGVTLNLHGRVSADSSWNGGFRVEGGDGADVIYTGTAADYVTGGAGDDVIQGGEGNDSLIGGVGVDNLNGGTGDDVLSVFDSYNNGQSVGDLAAGETYKGGAGYDTLQLYYGVADLTSVTIDSDIEKLVAQGAKLSLTVGQLDGFSYVDAGTVTLTTAGVVDLRNVDLHVGVFNLADGRNTLNLQGDKNNAHTVNGGAGVDVVIGGTLHDTLNGGGGADTLSGNEGADDLSGGAGNDSLDGGAGNDTLDGGAGRDVMSGGAGDDTLYLSKSGDALSGETYSGGDGIDTLNVSAFLGEVDLSKATIGADIEVLQDQTSTVALTAQQLAGFSRISAKAIVLTTGGLVDLSHAKIPTIGVTLNAAGNTLYLPDDPQASAGYQVTGLGGADLVTGGHLGDQISGGGGNDVLNGAAGNDTLDGGLGADSLLGGDGNDLLQGGSGADSLDGGDGGDDLQGGGGNDVLHGGLGNDVLRGGDGVDLLYGDDGNDTVILDTPSDALGGEVHGGAGYDTLGLGGGLDISALSIADFEAVYANSGPISMTAAQLGSLRYIFSGSRLTLTTGGTVDLSSADVWASDIQLSDAATTLIMPGTPGTGVNFYTVHGGAGDDHISGGYYYSTYFGGGGDDVLGSGVAGSDLHGGDGADKLQGGGVNDKLYGDAGDDLLIGGGGQDMIDGGDGVDTLSLAWATAKVKVSLATGVETDSAGGGATLLSVENLIGSGFADTFTGDAGANLLDGAAGADALNGGDGDDRLIGGLGDDTLSGGAGIDTADYSGATGALAIDLRVTTAQDEGAQGHDILSGIENLIGGAGNDALAGSDAANLIQGGAGGDTIQGLGGVDTLDGGSGDDTLDGGAGGDVLIGGVGRDQLTGGTGSDSFVFRSAADSGVGVARADGILDFSHAQHDTIDLSGLSAGVLAYIDAAPFHAAGAGEVRVVSIAGGQLVHVDVDGNGTADMDIFVASGGITGAADFVL